jgi:hypothetical protein
MVTLALPHSSIAQEHLLSKPTNEALGWARAIDSSVDYDSSYHWIILSHLSGYERWNFWPAVEIRVDSIKNRVKEVTLIFSYAFKPLNVLDRIDRKRAIKDLTKEFGKPIHHKTHSYQIDNLVFTDDGEFWRWTDSIGSYDFIRYRGSNACVLDCNLLQSKD